MSAYLEPPSRYQRFRDRMLIHLTMKQTPNGASINQRLALLTAEQRSLLRRAAALELWCVDVEARASDENWYADSEAAYQRLVARGYYRATRLYRLLLIRLGLERADTDEERGLVEFCASGALDPRVA